MSFTFETVDLLIVISTASLLLNGWAVFRPERKTKRRTSTSLPHKPGKIREFFTPSGRVAFIPKTEKRRPVVNDDEKAWAMEQEAISASRDQDV